MNPALDRFYPFLSINQEKTHRRGAEDAEGAQRLEFSSRPLRFLCASAVNPSSIMFKKE
jgi:hypothetical protein